MNLNLTGSDISMLLPGIEIIKNEIMFDISKDGIPVVVEKSCGDIEVVWNSKEGLIRYHEKHHFFRAFGILIEAIRSNTEIRVIEKPQFTMNGAMFDASRNAVLTVESIKKMLRKMALMGLNMMMLYTEDTYTIDEEPYFGYMRGRYTYDELNECDEYANFLGIEMIPCIQTLAHLTHALKWRFADEIKDTDRILLADNEKTYLFIEKMIKSASAPFRTKRIHIGMDEASKLGRGRYLDKYGYKSRMEIMNSHLKKVMDITKRHGLKPMIWSDMYLSDDAAPEVTENISTDIQFVCWDYYHNSEGFYTDLIQKHLKFTKNPVFAGGIWTWTGLCPNYYITFSSTNASLSACKSQGVKEVFATLWGDNGGETNAFTGLLGLQLFAEHGYSKELDINKLKARFKFCTGLDHEAFMDLSFIDKTPLTKEYSEQAHNPSKFILWQDILQGLFDKNIEGLNMSAHFAEAKKRILHHFEQYPKWQFIFDMYYKLCGVLSMKSDIGINIKRLYDIKDKSGLDQIAKKELPELYKRVEELRLAHRNQWFTTNKPFGWDILDIRYGGVLARINTVIWRINEYVLDKIPDIAELKEVRLYYDTVPQSLNDQVLLCKHYHDIVSSCPVSD